MAKEIILASYNKNKCREIAEIMSPVRVRNLADFNVDIDFDRVEDGATYEENALKKARVAAAHISGIVAADDSGLEVEALDGRPGVHAARYYGQGLDDAQRYLSLLEDMKDVPAGRRQARFVCVVAARFPDGTERIFRGDCNGLIHLEPLGASGFGYDPVFYLPELGLTMAQLSPKEKNRISHRAMAFQKLRRFLLKHY